MLCLLLYICLQYQYVTMDSTNADYMLILLSVDMSQARCPR